MCVQWGAGCMAALHGAARLTPLEPVTCRTGSPRLSHIAGRAGVLGGSVVWRSQVWHVVLSWVVWVHGFPRGIYLQPSWNHSDLNLLGVILSHSVLGTCWQVPVGIVSRVMAQGTCVGSGVGFHYLTLLSLSWLKEHTWTPELTFLRGIPGAGLYLS